MTIGSNFQIKKSTVANPDTSVLATGASISAKEPTTNASALNKKVPVISITDDIEAVSSPTKNVDISNESLLRAAEQVGLGNLKRKGGSDLSYTRMKAKF